MPTGGANHDPETAVIGFIADMDKSIISRPLVRAMEKWNPSDFDFLLHGGDFAYNVQDNDGNTGDEYFQMMSDVITTKLPYVVTPGNHEFADNGKFFTFRFNMPGGGHPLQRASHYFSFDYKGVHYVTVNADYVFLMAPSQRNTVLSWLGEDLKQANANPEINFSVFYSHRPFYCPIGLKLATDHCKVFYHWKPFESMLRKYKVDLYIFAHFHAIFRLKKQHNFINLSGQQGEAQPLMVVAGSSGALHEPFDPVLMPMTDYFYAGPSAWLQLTTNATAIKGEFFVSDEGKLLDQFILPKKKK
jgi:hypothetical protein